MNRICPSCKNIIEYKSYKVFWKAKKNNSKCRLCFYDSLKGRTLSEETKKKIGDANKISLIGNIPYNKGIPMSQEQKQKCSLSHKGKKLSELHIKNVMMSLEKSRYKRKPYIFSNGVVINIQGYENLTLDKLISENIPYDDIKLHIKDIPVIKYILNGVSHRYYPDCFLRKSNTIVETKSNYTWMSDLEENKQKILFSQSNGYNVRLLIWDAKKRLISDEFFKGVY